MAGAHLFCFTVTFQQLVDVSMVICVFTCIFNNTNGILSAIPFEVAQFVPYLLVVLFNPLIIYVKDQPVQDIIRTIIYKSF